MHQPNEDVHRRAERAVRAQTRVRDGYDAYVEECRISGVTPHDRTHYTLYIDRELGLALGVP